MKKFKAKIYLKNKKELNEYLKNLVKIKKNPTLEDVKFSFKWGNNPLWPITTIWKYQGKRRCGGNIIINNEIPKTIPVADYAGYIMKNFKPDVIKFKKPESEWTEEEHTEYTKWVLKLSMAHRFKQQIQENKPLTNRDKRIIERFRSGADFFGEKICGKETSRLFEQPYTFDLFNEWQEKHFKEHPEDKDKTIEELFDIRLSEQKLYHYKEVNGKYYGAEIPKEIHYTEYFRYLYFNVKYEFSEKTYYRSIPYTDKDKQESIWDRERCFVAQEISEWRVDELEDWQRDLIEKIRVGVELKDDDIVKAMGC